MRTVKSVFLFFFLWLCLSACFTPPEFPNTPKISFNKIQFKVTPEQSDADSLILFIDFTDGNGDLGLDNNYLDDPYHELNFYMENGAGQIKSVGTRMQSLNKPSLPKQLPMITDLPTGKLVTNRTRNKPGFGFLPQFNASNLNCSDYTTQYIIIAPSARHALDESYNIECTFLDEAQNEYLVLKDTIYFTRNLNYYNIRVRFYKSSGGPFTEFSFEDELCSTFNGRFQVLSDRTGPLKGTIRYTMTSIGFTQLFSIKNLRLDVIVKDRAFNKDSIRTPDFTLDKIRVN